MELPDDDDIINKIVDDGIREIINDKPFDKENKDYLINRLSKNINMALPITPPVVEIENLEITADNEMKLDITVNNKT